VIVALGKVIENHRPMRGEADFVEPTRPQQVAPRVVQVYPHPQFYQ
jgi:hypothetical protein